MLQYRINTILTEKNIAKFMWLGLAVTVQFFSTKYFRFNSGIFHLPLPVMVMVLICFALMLFCLMHQGLVRNVHDYVFFAFVCFLFFIWHICSALFSEADSVLVFREITKIGIGFICLWLILLAFPREESFLESFWIVVLWSSLPFFIYLLYLSLSARSFFLAADLEEITNRGPRNQLAWYLVIIFPYALLSFLMSRKRWLMIVPLLIFSVSLIYAASRSAWLCGFLALFYLPFFLWKLDRKRAVKSLVMLLIIAFSLITVGVITISRYGDPEEIFDRILWVFDPDKVPQYNSYGVREERIKLALEGFVEAPIVGHGIRDAERASSGADVHNDYATILAELGLIGEVLFVGILVFVGMRCLKRPKNIYPASWVFFATRASFINLLILMNFNTTYTSPQNWFFLGLFLVAAEIENKNDKRRLLRESTSDL